MASILFSPCVCVSQDAKDKWTPSISPQISLERVVVAKLTATSTGDSQISILLPQWRTEQRTREISLTKCRKETRTRMVPDPSGTGSVEQSYTVAVPYSETVTQSYNLQIPEKSKRIDIPWEHAKLLRAPGELVTDGEAQKILASPQHAFLIETLTENFTVDEYHRSVLSKEFLVLWIDPELLVGAKDQSPAPAAIPRTTR